MDARELHGDQGHHHGCCGCDGHGSAGPGGINRRDFLKASGVALGVLAMTGLTYEALAEEAPATQPAAAQPRKPLVVKPILGYEIPTRRQQTSWRSWGGIETQDQADAEVKRIAAELAKLAAEADFPVSFLDVSAVRNGEAAKKALADAPQADAVIVYAAGGGSGVFDAAAESGKHVMFFLRHRSGPVYLWYEIISPRYLRRHTDKLAIPGIDNRDVVVDSQAELEWRLRALCGLKNALGTKIVAIGGPAGWGPSGGKAPEHSREKWKLDISTVNYKELGGLLKAALADDRAVAEAQKRASAYLDDKSVELKTERSFVDNAFLLEDVFRRIMAKAGASALTINSCMGAIMPISKTNACLTLSLLNDAGYLAFCESDFVVIPSGLLLANISGRPHFLNDPTYPHGGVITLAHCTAPRRMDGKNLEPVKLVTHFESDYGAAPKVEMRKGQKVSMIIPDFAFEKWIGLSGEIVDSPFLPICRSQIDVAYKVSDAAVADAMPGFHWEMVYGDYLREAGYALRKTGIGWQVLG
jgi:L-fucose isomerase-like protein